MSERNTHALYVRDLADLLTQEARRATKSAPGPATDWESGYLMALVSILDLMKQQAVAFDLPMTDLGSLADLDPERELLPRRPVD
jgi:hypothetical protein